MHISLRTLGNNSLKIYYHCRSLKIQFFMTQRKQIHIASIWVDLYTAVAITNIFFYNLVKKMLGVELRNAGLNCQCFLNSTTWADSELAQVTQTYT